MHNDFGEVKYVQYDPKSLSGVIQFEHPIASKVVDPEHESKQPKFDGIKPEFRVLKGWHIFNILNKGLI